jgi:hypothetical protein
MNDPKLEEIIHNFFEDGDTNLYDAMLRSFGTDANEIVEIADFTTRPTAYTVPPVVNIMAGLMIGLLVHDYLGQRKDVSSD